MRRVHVSSVLCVIEGGNRKLFALLHVIIPIVMGVAIYALFRGIYLLDPTTKIFPVFPSSSAPDWLLYNLPDGLWLYSLLSVMIIIWRDVFTKHFLFWIILASLISLVSEIFQAIGIIPGTFDWWDILAYLIAITLFGINNFFAYYYASTHKNLLTK